MRRSARTDWISQAEETIAALPVNARFRSALLAAVRDLASDRQVLAAAITGSISRGCPDPKDIDLIVLTRGSRYGTRRRMYRGVSVHMLTRGIERWVRTNLGSRSRPFLLRPPLADAVILWDHEQVLMRSRARSRRRLARGPARATAAEIARLRAELVESLDDLQTCGSDRLAFSILATDYISRCGEVYLRLRSVWLPSRRNLLRELDEVAPKFARLCRKSLSRLSEGKATERPLRHLAEMALDPVGGLAEEYEVRWD